MRFFVDMNIRNKLLLGFGSLAVIAFGVGLFGYSQIIKIQTSDKNMYQFGAQPLEYIGDIATDFQRLRANLREHILARNVEKNAYYEQRIKKFRADIDETVKKLGNSLPDIDSQKLFAHFVDTRRSYTPHIDHVIKLSREGRDNDALAYIKSDQVDAAERAEITAIENLQNDLVAHARQIAETNSATAQTSGFAMLLLVFSATLAAALLTFLLTRNIVNPLLFSLRVLQEQEAAAQQRSRLVEAIASGDLQKDVALSLPLVLAPDQIRADEPGQLLKSMAGMSEAEAVLDRAFDRMLSILRRNRDEEQRRDRLKSGLNELNTILRGEHTVAELAPNLLSFLARFTGAGAAVLYLAEANQSMLRIAAGYACSFSDNSREEIRLGEGLAGQVALERKSIALTSVPPGYLTIGSGVGAADPASLLVMPIIYDTMLVGVIELASFGSFSDDDKVFLAPALEAIAIAINVNHSRQKVNDLLGETQSQAEELRVQQEELQQSNEELEERAQMLQQQREQISLKNREVEAASMEIRRKAEEVERVSSYKSEFLANMSHELRTPLNSLMILSSLLRDNRDGNLTTKQVEYAATINSAGKDLLNLINDILDLSKIESGRLEFSYESIPLTPLADQLRTLFRPVTDQRGLSLEIAVDPELPSEILSDNQRLQQILKNLISNACKFTHHGGVTVRFYAPAGTENPLPVPAVAMSVSDSGIGIPQDKQELIFQAFQQADGTTSRRFGGTGLGLSISRQLARGMGGDIRLSSETAKGSTFTLYLPEVANPEEVKTAELTDAVIPPPLPAQAATLEQSPKPVEPPPAAIPDDRNAIQPNGRSILIIEDDVAFAKILAQMGRDRGFPVINALDGESGIRLAEIYLPSAVILDVMLPGIDGWGVMRSLKDNPRTRHIPVHFITCLEDRQKAMGMGAVGFISKPVSSDQLHAVLATLENAVEKSMKMLLIVEDDQDQATSMVALLENRNVTITVAETGAEAIRLISAEQFDCIVLDLGLADMGAFDLLDELKRLDPERRIPVIIHTGRELSHEDERRLHNYAESIIIKGSKSPERLLNEVTLFLHLVQSSLEPEKQRMIRSAQEKEAMLEGKKVLIVDDDMRNIFSLSSALSEKGMALLEAENGCEALKQLDSNPDIDLVLMDIMMPEMDGYEAMRRIRNDLRFKRLPIIALTAKAMKGDREECLKAGASDYIQKPVDMDKLFSLLRVWLYTGCHDDN